MHPPTKCSSEDVTNHQGVGEGIKEVIKSNNSGEIESISQAVFARTLKEETTLVLDWNVTFRKTRGKKKN